MLTASFCIPHVNFMQDLHLEPVGGRLAGFLGDRSLVNGLKGFRESMHGGACHGGVSFKRESLAKPDFC